MQAQEELSDHKFHGEWDDEGVFVYQAYKDSIADYAIEHQKLGGPEFKPRRMTWIKPSFAWVLYRAGYGHKHNQERILKIKLSHESIAHILSQCRCGHGGGGSVGRVQWDPERDLMSPENDKGSKSIKSCNPRKMLQRRAIQIGMKDDLSEYFVEKAISIEDVTELSHAVGDAHMSPNYKDLMDALKEAGRLPNERDYLPKCENSVLKSLAMLHGEEADEVSRIGRGKAV
eukprot:m.12903 g.12903  ORF g.12903 m.12903 type:complete len:230 (-) comp4751_c0_seq1:323-1012(-)